MTSARSSWPGRFRIICDEIYRCRIEGGNDLLQLEKEVLGIDHAELGALYLKKQVLPEFFIEIVQFHHQPDQAQHHASITAAVQVADLLVRHAKIGNSGNRAEVPFDAWTESAGWKLLFAHQTEEERTITRAGLKRCLETHPHFAAGKMVGAVRFELTTSCTRNKRATRLRYAPTQSTKI